MRYEDVQHTPRSLNILLVIVLAVSVTIHAAVLFAVSQGSGELGTAENGWFGHWGWLIPAPLLIAFMYIIFRMAKMYVWVDDTEVRVRMRPFHIADRRFAWTDVKSFEVRHVSPFGEFGGWGIRWNPFNGKTGYIWGGKDGLELNLMNGKRVVITVEDGDRLRSTLDGNDATRAPRPTMT